MKKTSFPFIWFVVTIFFFSITPQIVTADVKTPISVQLAISSPPILNEIVQVNCAISSVLDAPNSTAEIILPEGAHLVSGNLKWSGDLLRDVPVLFSVYIVFVESGNWTIKALARHVLDTENSWGDLDAVHVNVGPITGALGFSVPVDRAKTETGSLNSPQPAAVLNEELFQERVSKYKTIVPLIIESASENPGNLTVTGYWSYYDRTHSIHPQRYNLVELLTGSNGHLAFAYTDSSGYFSIGPVANPGGTGIKVRVRTYVKWAPDNYEEMVVPNGSSSSWTNTFYGDTFTYVFADGVQSVGSWYVVAGATNEGAWWIQDDLSRGFLYPLNQPGSVTVEWTADSTTGTYYCVGEHIHLKAEDRLSPDTVIHEMGHNVMYNVYGNFFPLNDCPSPHYINVSGGQHCGWTEGWADFYALAVNGHPTYTWPSGASLNLETPTWGTSGWDNGDQVEGRVAGALWDILDSNNDGYDHIWDGFGHIWYTVFNHNDNTFSEYWSDLKTSGINVSSAADALYQNTINEAGPPTGTITINNGAVATKNTSVTLTLTASSGVNRMCVSNTATCTTFSAFAATKSWILSTGSGTKTVRVWFRDQWGNTTPSPSLDTIILDSTAPTNGTVTATPGNTQVILNWSGFSDALSGIAGYVLRFATGSAPSSCTNGTLLYSGPNTSFPHTGLTNGTTYGYRVCAKDGAGNTSTGATRTAKPQ